MSLHGALHLAPIKEGVHDALDIGTGTGIWAIEFGIASTYSYHMDVSTHLSLALKYASASVIGTDLSPIQPQL